MKNMLKYISLSLCAFAVSFSAFADGDGDSGVDASKTARNNYDGTYTLELEAFVKGQNVTVHSEKPVPVNAVLVLDVSGSMSTSMGSGSEYLYTAQQYDIAAFYNLNQDTYYFQLDDGSNASFVVSGWSGATNSTSQTKTGTLTVNGQEYVLSVTRTRRNGNSSSWTYPTVDPSPISSPRISPLHTSPPSALSKDMVTRFFFTSIQVMSEQIRLSTVILTEQYSVLMRSKLLVRLS